MVKLRPRTRAIASSTSFFISFVKKKRITIADCYAVDCPAYMFVVVYLSCSY